MLRHCESTGRRFVYTAANMVCGCLVIASLVVHSTVVLADGKPTNSVPASGGKAQPAFDPGVLVGQVVTPDGKPVAGAKLLLRGRTQRGAKSDADGRFRFEYVQPGHLSIQAIKGSLISPRVEFDGESVPGFKTGKFAPLKITVSEGKALKVLVKSAATGKPLEGAKLRLWFLSWREPKTGKDGTATLEGLAADNYQLSVELPGYASASRDVQAGTAGAADRVEFALAPGGVIRGTVTDEEGHPVEGAQVWCIEGNRGVGSTHKTDSRGAFRYESIPLNATIRVSISKDNYLQSEKSVALSTDRRDLEIAIKSRRQPPGGSIEGFVRDEKARPIAGASVESFGNSSNQRRKTTTDRAGHYVLHNLYESWSGYAVVIRAPGRAPLNEYVKPGTKDKPAHFDFTLEPGHFIHGRIVGENGKPIGGVQVSLAQDYWQTTQSKQSDAQGRFDMESLPANARFQIVKQGYSNLWNVPLRLDGAGATTVVLQPMGVIRGRVVDAKSKQPLDHFQVWLNFSNRRNGNMQWTMSGNWNYPGRQIDSKDGTFTIDNLMNGFPGEVGVIADGYARDILPLVVAVPPDEAKPVEIALSRIDPTHVATVSGRIVDHDGRGVPGASLRLILATSFNGRNDYRFNWWQIRNDQLGGSADCEQYLRAVSDSEGRFEFKSVLPGKSWELAYWGAHVPEGKQWGTTATRPDRAEKVTVKLPKLGRIAVTIDRVKYADAAQLNVQLAGSWSQTGNETINAGQSNFEIEDLAPGTYNISIQGKPTPVKTPQGTYYQSSTLGNKTIVLKAGESKSVQF
jgi:protocatechuate 3,4-dioxygenase beta subunit